MRKFTHQIALCFTSALWTFHNLIHDIEPLHSRLVYIIKGSAWCFAFLYLLYFLIIIRPNIFNFLLNFGNSKLLPPHCLHYGLNGPLAHVFIFIICTTHVPQTFVVAIKPDEFISVILSPLHFYSARKSVPQVLLKHVTQNYARIFHQQQSWTDLYCYVSCTCTAMVYTGQAYGLVHGRVKKIDDGGRWVGELLSFPLNHSTWLILAHYLTVYSIKLFTLVKLYMLFHTHLFTLLLTQLM